MQEYDFHVRWPTVRLLTVLLTNRPKDLQECLLVVPMAVSKLMDLLSDSREIIRNDVSGEVPSTLNLSPVRQIPLVSKVCTLASALAFSLLLESCAAVLHSGS